MKKTILLFTALLTFIGAQAQEIQHYIADDKAIPREHNVDFTHALIDVRFDPKAGKVIGEVQHTFKTIQQEVDSLYLDGPGIEVKSATFDDETIVPETTEEGLIFRFEQPLTWGSEHQLTINYEAYPQKGIYFIGWNDTTNRSRKQIWTQGQGTDNRCWFPHYDTFNDKLITETKITFDDDYKVLSNGELLKKKKNKDGTVTWHYKISHPHASYLVMIGIGDYSIKTIKSESGTPINLYYYPDWENRVDVTYTQTKRMFDWFEDYIGVDYPWGSYSQIPVQDFLYGAMENTTATVFGDFFFTDDRGFLDRNYVYVNAHEFAHQWFGDLVTSRSGEAHWLHESFATYYHGLWTGQVFGQDAFDWMMHNSQNVALGAGEKDDYPIRHLSAGSGRHYMKGAFVLKMLNYVLGEEQYRKVIQDYLNAHPYQNVDTEDLLTQIQTSLGLSLNWFFDEWVYRGGEPHYKVDFMVTEAEKGKQGVFSVEQIQEQTETVGLFDMPIVFEIHLKNGNTLSKKVRIDETLEWVRFDLSMEDEVAYVLFDPNNEVLKHVTFEKSPEYLLEQLRSAAYMIDRYDAAVALNSVALEQKEAALLQAFEQEKFHAVRAEAVRQLINQAPIEWQKKALTDADVEVRKAAVGTLSSVSEEILPIVESRLADSSYTIIEQTLNLLAAQHPEKLPEYLKQLEGIEGNNHKNIRLAWLKYQLMLHPGDELFEAELTDYTSNSFEFITRQNAADLANSLNVFNQELFYNLMDGVLNRNSKLRNSHRKAIKFYATQYAKKQQMKTWLEASSYSASEKAKVERLF
tara:strand:+ start:4689 stop:7094 length:2406 start_codon:yes stop_codon:yes gene_type:complete